MGVRKRDRKRTTPRPHGETLARLRPLSASARAVDDGVPRRVASTLEALGFSAAGVLLGAATAEQAVREWVWSRKLGKPVPETYSIADLKEHAPTFEDLPGLIRSIPSALSSPSVRQLLVELRRMERQPTENRERTGKETSSDAGAADSGSVSTVRN